VINNAGIQRVHDLAADNGIDDNAVVEEIQTNLLGVIRRCGVFIPHLRRRPQATIINVSSGLAFVPMSIIPVCFLRQQQPLDIESIKNLMSDHFSHPHSTCAHVDENEPENLRLETRCSVLISLNTRTMYVTDRPPCTSEYETFRLADTGTGQRASKTQVASLGNK
jgi:NAD(P)-dependent dehydrogenase (short-subunit alcohol dehydrogenase family)